MHTLGRFAWASLACLTLAATLTTAAQQKDAKDKDQDRRPKLTLKVQPAISMAPSRVVLTAELIGGASDFEEYYCPTVEWEWGDGTTSEATNDCEPYQPGRSEIRRRFIVNHVFRAGDYRVMFRLKKHDKSVALATANVQVRQGLRDLDH